MTRTRQALALATVAAAALGTFALPASSASAAGACDGWVSGTKITAHYALEGSPVSVTISGCNAGSSYASVPWSTAPGSASTTDYATPGKTLTVPPGFWSRDVSVPTVADSVKESNESFFVKAGGSSGRQIVLDDDPAGFSVLSPDQYKSTASNRFLVIRSGSTASAATVTVKTVALSDKAPALVTPSNGVVSFPAGVRSRVVTVSDACTSAGGTYTLRITSAPSVKDSAGTGHNLYCVK